MTRYTVLGIAREGWPIILAVACAAALAGLIGMLMPLWASAVVWFIGAVVTLWAVWFFRDPERRTPADPGALVCGADGVVCFVGAGAPPPEAGIDESGERGMTRISVFMNIFNVHVNRAPVSGVVERVAYKPGRFFNASLDKASEHNERLSLVLRRDDGRLFVAVQIAGLVARRIVCRVAVGSRLAAGERFGMIRFGSRVDHYVPEGSEVLARVGQRVVAGETVLARVTSDRAATAARAPALQRAGA